MKVAIKNKKPLERVAYVAVFTALAIVLSFFENLIPIGSLLPIPGVKIGFANIVTVFGIAILSPWDTAAIIIIRCLVTSLFTGPVSLLFSLAGGLLAWLIMLLLFMGHKRFFSIVGISMGGAMGHSIGQILVAVLVVGDPGLIFYYLPFLLLISVVTGAITGFAASPLIKRFAGDQDA